VHLKKRDVVAGIRAEKGCRVSRLLAVERDPYLSCVRYDVIVGQDLAAAVRIIPLAPRRTVSRR